MNESKFENKISEKLFFGQGKAKINENFYSPIVSDIKESNMGFSYKLSFNKPKCSRINTKKSELKLQSKTKQNQFLKPEKNMNTYSELKLPAIHPETNKHSINSAYKPADINFESANIASNLEVISADSTIVTNPVCDKVVTRSVEENQNINLMNRKPNFDTNRIELVVSNDKGISRRFNSSINQRLSKYLFIICNNQLIEVNLTP